MRIPVSNADLDQGRLTKISRALQKLWQLDSLSLMQAQNTMATFLGYRNLHDLQGNVCPASQFSPTKALSREAIRNTVAWQIFRRHGINFFRASEIAAGLHLNTLDVDALTSDADFERTQDQYRQRGQLLMVDEAWQYLNPHWNPKTPQLLDANIPGYQLAVLPNRQVFRWGLLERLLGQLPADFMADLRQEPKYAGIQPGNALEMLFVTEELLPSACESLVESAKKAEIRPNGFEIMWLFSGDGECIGRVLHNKALGGIIPVLYDIADDEIYQAIGNLFCGELIHTATTPALPDDAPVYTLQFCYGGYDLAKDIRTSVRGGYDGATKPTKDDLVQLPPHIRFRKDGEGFTLLGSTFSEHGQTYLRYQPQWLRAADIPTNVLTPSDIDALLVDQSERWYLDTQSTIPEAASMLYEQANQSIQGLFSNATARLQNPRGIANLTDLLFSLVEPGALDAYCDALINEYLPVRTEESVEDDAELLEDRSREEQMLEWNGAAIKKVTPALAPFKDSSLGLLLLLVNGEYPGSRHGGWVYPPKGNKPSEIAELLVGLVLHAACCHARKAAPDQTLSANVLGFSVDSVIEGRTSPDNISDVCLSIAKFCKQLEDQAAFEKGITDWQQSADAMAALRLNGEFLYVGQKIGREKPKTMADLFAQSRSSGFAMITAEQTFADMARKS